MGAAKDALPRRLGGARDAGPRIPPEDAARKAGSRLLQRTRHRLVASSPSLSAAARHRLVPPLRSAACPRHFRRARYCKVCAARVGGARRCGPRRIAPAMRRRDGGASHGDDRADAGGRKEGHRRRRRGGERGDRLCALLRGDRRRAVRREGARPRRRRRHPAVEFSFRHPGRRRARGADGRQQRDPQARPRHRTHRLVAGAAALGGGHSARRAPVRRLPRCRDRPCAHHRSPDRRGRAHGRVRDGADVSGLASFAPALRGDERQEFHRRQRARGSRSGDQGHRAFRVRPRRAEVLRREPRDPRSRGL